MSPFHRELRQYVNDPSELREKKVQTVLHEDELGVVGDIARCGTGMNDTSGSRRRQAVHVYVAHDCLLH